MPEPRKWTLMIVNDEEGLIEALKRTLQREPYDVLAARDGHEALEALAEHGRVDAVLADDRMPRMGGTDLLERVQDAYPDTTRVLFTAVEGTASIVGACRSGLVHQLFTYPWDETELRTELRRLVRRIHIH